MRHFTTLVVLRRAAEIAGSQLCQLTYYRAIALRSYQDKNLTGINLDFNDLTGWDFHEQNLAKAYFAFSTLTNANLMGANLTNAFFSSATLTNANFTGAVVSGTGLSDATNAGFTSSQLYSTRSYQEKDIRRIQLGQNDLSGWDFHDQNLTGADFFFSKLTNANLAGANLSNTFLFNATLTSASLAGANLSNANLLSATLVSTDLMGANLKNAHLDGSNLSSAKFSPASVYNQWTVFPGGFDPAANGLTRVESAVGDFDANENLDGTDIEWLQSRVALWGRVPSWLPGAMFDVNSDGSVTRDDITVWVKDLKHTYFGDANLDGDFNSTDLIQVFAAGRYEAPQVGDPATWSVGDWNTDGEFNTGDLIIAFQDGGYDKAPQPAVASVPEPSGLLLMTAALCGFMRIPMHRKRASVGTDPHPVRTAAD